MYKKSRKSMIYNLKIFDSRLPKQTISKYWVTTPVDGVMRPTEAIGWVSLFLFLVTVLMI